MTDWSWMLPPMVACLVAIAPLGWFGFHVLQREVIFVDLALAQIAALGTTWALFLGYEPDTTTALVMSLAFTAAGSFVFSLLRTFESRVPQEAIIGIAYAVSAALGILLVELATDPHGAEKIQHLLVGNIVWVRWDEIAMAAGAVVVAGALQALHHKKILAISLDPAKARADGLNVPLWDLVFYLSFGLVLTAIVNIVGVLLVFSFLVIPAVVGRLLATTTGARFAVGYGLAAACSLAGVAVSYEHSTGPIVVAFLGASLLAALVFVAVRDAEQRGQRVAQVAGLLALGGLGIGGTYLGLRTEGHDHQSEAAGDHAHEHVHEHDAHAANSATAPDASAAAAPPTPDDPLTQLGAAVAQARGGDARGLVAMAALLQGDAPFIRDEAVTRLRQVALDTAPTYDPSAGPDAARVWEAWAQAPPAGWEERARALADP